MRQGLHRRCQDESGKVEIGNVDLAAMGFEIAAKKPARVSLDRFDVFEPSGAGDLLGEDAVKLRIDTVSLDRGCDEFARRDVDRARGDLEQGVEDHLRQFLRVALDDGRDQRLLAREVLVERADADAGHGRDLVGARPVVAFLDQNASSRFDKRIDSQA
jgi:hypothetical protein